MNEELAKIRNEIDWYLEKLDTLNEQVDKHNPEEIKMIRKDIIRMNIEPLIVQFRMKTGYDLDVGLDTMEESDDDDEEEGVPRYRPLPLPVIRMRRSARRPKGNSPGKGSSGSAKNE